MNIVVFTNNQIDAEILHWKKQSKKEWTNKINLKHSKKYVFCADILRYIAITCRSGKVRDMFVNNKRIIKNFMELVNNDSSSV